MYSFTVMHENTAVAEVNVSDDHKEVSVIKLVKDSMKEPEHSRDEAR